LLLFNFGFMLTPMLANLLTRLVTRERWDALYLRPEFRKHWTSWLAAWFLPAILTVLGAALFFLVFPRFFDTSFTQVKTYIAESGQTGPVNPWSVILVQALGSIVISPLIFAVFTFGEEFGWRGYLLPKLLPLGTQRAVLLQGLVWGIWYLPMIAMGYEYGLHYPGFPWLGMLVFLLFTISNGTFLAWVMLRGESVWPAVIGHAAIDGIATISLLVLQGNPNPLIGPIPTGIVSGLVWLIFAAVLLLIPRFWPAQESAAESGVVVPQ
jgi:membrane protease YdiL (CAAX protease family)